METQTIRSEKKARPQRALVLQGGGALGAYEAGAFKALYEFITKQDKSNPLFDIVAGTSIGAINAAILVSYVIENNNNWNGSDEKILGFWKYVASWDVSELPVFMGLNAWWNSWWNGLRLIDKRIASPEAARRYYTAKLAGCYGVPTVFNLDPAVLDTRYFDNLGIPNNMWFRYDPNLLKDSIQKYCRFPIKANVDREDYPRLLTISTDILEGVPVVFDSYLLESDVKVDGNVIYTIDYRDGILPDHIIASASVPINYNYKIVKDKKGNEHYLWDGGLLSNTPLTELLQLHYYYYYEHKVEEKGGPGADNWKNLTSKDWDEISIPDLKEVYMINVNPTTQPSRPIDHDNALSRCLDINLSDKTRIVQSTLESTDEIIDILGSYRNLAISLVKEFGADAQQKIITILKNFISEKAYDKVSDPNERAKLNEIHETILGRILYELNDTKYTKIRDDLKKEIKNHQEHTQKLNIPEKRVLGRKNRSTLSAFIPKHYGIIPMFNMDNASFRVNDMQRIERRYDGNDIAGKMFDFSKGTIMQLIKEGYNDTCIHLEKQVRD